MKSLAYLTYLKAKNRILEVLHKPSQLIMVLFVLGLIGFTAVSAEYSEAVEYRNINELYSIVFVLYSFIFISISKNGFHSGASMFSMADVNLLFSSPIKSGNILSFGLFQQLGRALTLGIFILYQSATVRMNYDVGFSALVYILIGYSATVFLAQMLAMLIYSSTCSDEKKQKIGKVIFYSVVAVFVAVLLGMTFVREKGLSLMGMSETLENPLFALFPVSGVTTLFVKGTIGGEAAPLIISVAVFLLFIAAFYFAVSRLNTDYYEDVLAATEISFSAITARKEGKAAETAPRNVKKGKIGLEKGFGARAIAEKHKIENRRSKVFILSPMALVFLVVSVVFSFVFLEEPIAIFTANVYLLIFSAGTSRWAKELSYPYVYLMPDPPAKKLFNMIKSEIPTLILESIICFAPVYIIMKLRVTEVISMVMGRISFGVLIIGVNLLLQRLFGSSDKKVLVYIAYMFFFIFFSAPGIAAALFASTVLPYNTGLEYLALALVNGIVSGIMIFASRNILEYAELNNK